ncbi:MAG TPA: hypothetical protein VGF48_04710 [Thermoanaerobaculia bacterium]|jgi:hypothetical protein
MSFIVKILFSGLMAFVPNQDGTELTVLLLNVPHAYHTSDGASMEHHNAAVIARAGNCVGDCPQEQALANAMFPDKTAAAALAALQSAMGNGAGWQLSASDISVRKATTSAANLPALTIVDNVRSTVNGEPQSIPNTAAAREDYSWLADMSSVCSGCTLNPALLGNNPPAGLIAARFRIRNGRVSTYSVIRLGSNVAPVTFKRLDGTGSASSYSQALASWVATEIEVTGDAIEIVEDKFDGTAGRSMKLSPDSNGKVELAVLNLPSFEPPASPNNDAPQVGKHFELFYELASNPPAEEARFVPRAADPAAFPTVNWQTVHPSSALFSDLLNGLRLNVGRGPYDRLMCPMVGWP